jgi:two-component system chemotaxis response regulator CheB
MPHLVLIADDNPFIRTALYEFFQREPDFKVCGLAENGQEAIEAARRLHPDLIVLDFDMPVMNGLSAARILKQIIPKVVLVMYSASETDVCKQVTLSAGISGLVSKRDRVSVLIETARTLIYQRAA